MKIQRIKTMLLCLCVGAALISIPGCGGGNIESVTETTPTLHVEVAEALVLLVPVNTLPLFSGLALLIERSGLPFEFELQEVAVEVAGIQSVVDKKADIMFLMRRPQPDEALAFYELFLSSTAIFVNADIGIKNLTRAEAAAIFAGELTNWAQLGGPDLAITVFIQHEDDSNTFVMQEHILEMRTFDASAQVLFNDHDMLTVVGGMPGAVGYTAWISREFYQQDASVEYPPAVSLDDRTPEDPAYPMWIPAGLVFRPEREEELLPVLAWVSGFLATDVGRTMGEQYGFRVGDPILVEPGDE